MLSLSAGLPAWGGGVGDAGISSPPALFTAQALHCDGNADQSNKPYCTVRQESLATICSVFYVAASESGMSRAGTFGRLARPTGSRRIK